MSRSACISNRSEKGKRRRWCLRPRAACYFGVALSAVLTFTGCSSEPPVASDGSSPSTRDAGLCQVDESRCAGSAIEACDANGQFTLQEECPFACEEGVCIGECTPMDTRCSEDSLDVCSAAGAWMSRQICAGLCTLDGCEPCPEGDRRTIRNGEAQICQDGRWERSSTCSTECVGAGAYIKAKDATAGQLFGFRVAISGDTALIGAPSEDGFSGAAYIFVHEGEAWVQQAKLQSDTAEAAMGFGWSVAVDGDIAVVGTPWESNGIAGADAPDGGGPALSPQSGAAFIFTRTAGSWSQTAYLKANNADDEDSFGGGVAVSGETVAVSARNEASRAQGVNGNETDNGAPDSGAVYIFTLGESGWQQTSYLKSSNSGPGDLFGWDIDLDSDILVVGAPGEGAGSAEDEADNSKILAGAGYVFVREEDGRWHEQAYLKAPNVDDNDVLGQDVAISGETLVIGAFGDSSAARGVDGDASDNSAPNSGAAYVFHRAPDQRWEQQAYLKAHNSEMGDEFGAHVDIHGDFVVVASVYEDGSPASSGGTGEDNNVQDSGAAYLFQRSGSKWVQEAYLKAPIGDPDDRFAVDVGITSGAIAVGAFLEDAAEGDPEDNSAPASGAVYLFPLR